MVVDGQRQEKFKVLSYKYSPLAYSPDATYIGNSGIINEGENDFGTLELEIYLETENQDKMHNELSQLNKIFRVCVLEFDETTVEYVCSLKSFNVEKITPVHTKVNITFDAYSRGKLVEVSLSSTSNSIVIKGNLTTDVEYEFKPSGSKDMVKINDIEIKNVTGGQTYLLSGIKKKVVANGKNIFNDTNIFKFPSLEPGENTITLNHSDINLKLRYYPRYY